MSTFKEIQTQLTAAKRTTDQKQREVFLAKEALKRVGKDKDRAIRGQRPNGASMEELLARERSLQDRIQAEELNADRLAQAATDFALQFLPFTDPRQHIGEWSDNSPALLMPLRMETRFKRVENAGELRHQLWVRVFPDECSIDTFEDIPSETEIKRAQDYWMELWAAGSSDEELLVAQIEERKKGAWKVMASSVQAGRAYWLTQQYQPENQADLPERNGKTDVLLIIPATTIPANAAELITYWEAVWTAGTNEATQAAARSDLNAAVGDAATAQALIENFQPFNLGETGPQVSLRFLEAASADSARAASDEEVFLDVLLATDQSIPPEWSALSNYWIAIWRARGNAAAENQAFQALEATVGSNARAIELITDFVPGNLNDFSPPQVRAHFIDFPADPERKDTAWSQPARIKTLPERLVLLGYRGKDDEGKPIEVLSEIGAYIPDPLIVGPNPSIDASEVLAEALTLEYNELADDQARRDQLALYYDQSTAAVQTAQTEAEYVASFDGLEGEVLTEALSTAFNNLRDDVKAGRYVEYLCQRSETKWLFDFERAVEVGMGFTIDLSREQYVRGFDRLFVVGAKMSADQQEGKACLEQLLKHHHYGASGLSLLPQGFATNNTETTQAGFAEDEENEQTYERYLGPTPATEPTDNRLKRDGQWLTEWLGLDPAMSTLNKTENYYHTDQLEARAMNTALYNATLGYFMNSMMTPVFSESDKELARDFFLEYVSGRGALPAIRIGDQPYGVLPVSRRLSNNWLFQRDNLLLSSRFAKQLPQFRRMYGILGSIRTDFEELLDEVPYVGKAGDPHQILLDILGLHATSVDYYQRYSQSFQHLYNYLVSLGTFNQSNVLSGLQSFFSRLFNPSSSDGKLNLTNNSSFNEWLETEYREAGLELLAKLGYDHDLEEVVPILEKFFFTKGNLLKGDVVDDLPLSESRIVRPYFTPAVEGEIGQNYLQWLAEKASSDFEAIKRQTGFLDNKRPNALLYQTLRHSLLLGYSETGFKLYQRADALTTTELRAARVDPDFLNVQTNLDRPNLTRWSFLDHQANLLGNNNLTVAEEIRSNLASSLNIFETQQLREEIAALQQLGEVPTARLERLFAEHIDCCSYRLDAWLMGFQRLQLEQMRNRRQASTDEDEPSGIYLGTYGWVENLRPDSEVLTTATLTDELAAIFDPDEQNDIVEDSNNAGFIHAPSINQALTAAVLRNAYITNADEDNDSVYKVNLSSERVRMAMGIIEGMQQGQSLGALLGYQLERGLHDRTDEELDVYIYELRKLFPLASNRNRATDIASDEEAIQGDKSVSKQEARNVVDGRKLVEHVERTKSFSYPFGLPTGTGARELKAVENENQRQVIDREVERLRNINDALSDLAIAEGIHQVVQANFDRASNAFESFSKGAFPQTPEVVRTPRSGITLTHRFGVQLKTQGLAAPTVPREITDPYVAELVSNSLPPVADIACMVELTTPAYVAGDPPTSSSRPVTIADLGLEAIDLFYLLDVKTNKQLTALDEYIIHFIRQAETPRPDTRIKIHYTQEVTDKFSLFEIAALLESLRAVVLGARPLRPSDMQLPNETSGSADAGLSIERARVADAFTVFEGLQQAFQTDLYDKLVSPTDFGKYFTDDRFAETAVMDDTFLNDFDQILNDYLTRLEAFKPFSVPETGFGYVYDRKATIYSAIYTKGYDYLARWEEKLLQFDQLIADSLVVAPNPDDNLTDEERIELLRRAERFISTEYTSVLADLPGPPGDEVGNYRNFLQGTRRPAFAAKKLAVENFLDDNPATLRVLIAGLNATKFGADPLSNYDLIALETAEEERQIVVLAEDVVSHCLKVMPILDKINTKVNGELTTHDSAVENAVRIKSLTTASQLLFGEDFQIVPTFTLTDAHRNELQQSLGDTAQLLAYQMTQGVDFPVDNWLYGVARVREGLGEWENLTVLSDSFTGQSLDLSPIQLPYVAEDSWLALEYDPGYEIKSDKLLYTAYFREADFNAPQAGLLSDEWTEVLPTKMETTGLSFQYDQPATEPPQTMLLVTPARMNGEWEWEDLPGALHEALDLARLRALEPDQIAQTPYAQFLPATVSSVTRYPLATMALNYSLNNNLVLRQIDN